MPDVTDNERVRLNGILAEFRQALEEEIHKVKSSGLSSTLLFAGRRIESRDTEFWYRFSVEYAPAMPADTPCKLTVGQEQFNVTVVSFDENSIIISSKIELTGALGKARLENGATVLMERLIGRIEENAEKPNPAGDRMLLQNDNKVYEPRKLFHYDKPSTYPGNTESQNRAVEAALANDITYIWGPPGTGKTTVIGQIIDELCRYDRPVLVVSHTNTAVDGAIEKADRTYYSKHGLEEGGSYPILRLGTPSKPLPERVLLKTHTDILGRELYEREAFLKNLLASMQRRQKEIGLLLSKNIWIEKTHLPLFLGDMHPTYEDRISTKRDLPKLTVRTPDGKEIQLKDGEHNAIQKQIIEEFLPRFGYGAILLYCGDSDKKYGLIHEVEELAKIGFTDLKQSILPDVVAYSPEKNWIFLIEAYHTSNPITPQRKMELEQELGENANRVVFVTAFENDSVYRNCPEELAWETEVWIATEPDHMIHRNGHRFMGPYSSNVKRGCLVKHSDLGEGTVVKKENDYIEVTFPEQFKTIRFPYPEVMEHDILKALEV